MSEWRTIDSAPKDATEILGWREDCGVILIRWDCAETFLTERELKKHEWTEEQMFAEDWFCADFICGERLDGDLAPTHWMPLPEYPDGEQNDLISAIKTELSIGDTVSRSYRAMELIKEYER